MILGKLKEATREQHDALENVVDVMSRTFTIEDYRTLLLKFYRFYAAVEPLLPVDDLKAEGFDVEPRRKLPKLESDLEHIGVLEDAKNAPAWTDVPDLSTTAKAFGAIYVMEGATLGGQVITRHLKEHLGLTPEEGGAFFNSYGKEVGPMWKEFGTAITAFAERNAGSDDDTVEAARQTFDSFRKCFASDEAFIRTANS